MNVMPIVRMSAAAAGLAGAQLVELEGVDHRQHLGRRRARVTVVVAELVPWHAVRAVPIVVDTTLNRP